MTTEQIKPFNFTDLFGPNLISIQNESSIIPTTDALSGLDAVGIYFSAHWCPPCRSFTPNFAKNYQALKDAGKKFETVFISADLDEEQFNSYFSTMPWLALPFNSKEISEKLNKDYNCQAIPYLVIVDAKTGKTINSNGRGWITHPTFIENFPYHPKLINDLSEDQEGLFRQLSLVMLQEGVDSEVQKENFKILMEIALKLEKTDKESRVLEKIFTGNSNCRSTNTIRTQIGFPSMPKVAHEHETPFVDIERAWACDGCHIQGTGNKRYRCVIDECDFDMCEPCMASTKGSLSDDLKFPKMVLLDWSEMSFFLPNDEIISEETILKFIEDYKNKNLTRNILKEEKERTPVESFSSFHQNFYTTLCVFQEKTDKELQDKTSEILLNIATDFKNNTKISDRKIQRFLNINDNEFDLAASMRPRIGFPSYLDKHRHPMETNTDVYFDDYFDTWKCNKCHEKYGKEVEQLKCLECPERWCGACITKSNLELSDEVKTPGMIVQDFSARKFYVPLEGQREVSKENILSFIEEYSMGKLERKDMYS